MAGARSLALTGGLLLTLAPAAAPAAGAADPEPRHVVILNAADPYLPAFQLLDRAFRDTVRAGYTAPLELHAETLDMHRFPRAQLDREVLALLRGKYRDLKVDVVVAAAPIALDFAERNRDEIWPGATIVFHSVPVGVLSEGRSLAPRTIGLPVRLDFGPTLALALRLLPGARRIAVVAGTGDPDRRNLALARPALERLAGALDIRYLVGLTLADTLAAVRALPADALVLYLSVYRDADGKPLVPRDVLTQVAAASPVPAFGVFETYVGSGIAAGSIATYATQGQHAGELVARVLKGEDPERIGSQAPATARCIADGRQLQRWDIDEGLLPADCEIRFRELTAWQQYRWQIATGLAVILAQAALIVTLVVNRRRLRRARNEARDELGRRTQAEGLAARLRNRLGRFARERSLGAMATAISHEINQPLIAIQNYAQAARRRLAGGDDDRAKLTELFAKIEGQAERAGAITQRVRSLVSASEPVLAPTPPRDLLDEIIRIMAPEIESRGCRVAAEGAADLPGVMVDALQVELVLVNLVRNAMQSACRDESRGRQIRIDARRAGEREVQFSVADQGPGVPPDRAEDIFEPLSSGTSGGMGMGLSICREIVQAHGGRLWYEPNPAGGAIFRFTLKAAGS
jgi:signal transduction histidine kinase